LLAQRRRQLGDVERREQLAVRARELKTEEAKHQQTIVTLKRRRGAMFQAAGCDDEQAYRMMAADQHQAVMLGNQRDAVSREILAAIGRHEPEEVFAKLLAPESIGALEADWEKSAAELEACQTKLKALAEERGEFKREQTFLAEDRSLAERQLDLSVVEHQLAEARDRWREHAAVGCVLERIRADYEAHRQPETLGEASRYMAQLTGGRYRRIWTPLAHDVLLVENADGQSLPVDVLSRGTREQLFLSVRLALVATFARRGVNLPMVLDDVLVNFDVGRAQRAAEVLSEFAAAGHQLLFFTCHEHIWNMLKALDADCRRLPVRRGQAEPEAPKPAPVAIEEPIEAPTPAPPRAPAKKKPRRRVRPAVIVETPAEDWYEYPFVERLIAEPKPEPDAASVPVETAPAWCEYSFEPTEFAHAHGASESERAIAYIVGASAERKPAGGRPSRGRTIIGGSNRGYRDDRDHLEPRRA
jgi:hypothetical protein